MRLLRVFILLVVPFLALGERIVCYFTYWSKGRPGDASFSVENVDPFLCTHIIYAFLTIDLDNQVVAPQNADQLDVLRELVKLKDQNPDLKILANVGGWSEGSERFSAAVYNETMRSVFAKNSVDFLQNLKLDGLELGWLYPGTRDKGRDDDPKNYPLLFKEIRKSMKGTNLLLTISFKPLKRYITLSIDVPEISKHVDFMNAITYDFLSVYGSYVGHPAHLYPLNVDSGNQFENVTNVDATITDLLQLGVPPEKVTMGVPTFGRFFKLADSSDNEFGSSSAGPAASRTVGEKGIKNFYEICEDLDSSWKVVRVNASAVGPYAYRSNQWVAYDDEDTVRLKANYVKRRKLGGLNFWTIDDDDFSDVCGKGRYPLISAGKEVLIPKETEKPPQKEEKTEKPVVVTESTPRTTVSTEPATPKTTAATKPATQPTTAATQPTTAPTQPTTPIGAVRQAVREGTKPTASVPTPPILPENIPPYLSSFLPGLSNPQGALFSGYFQNNLFFQDIKISNNYYVIKKEQE